MRETYTRVQIAKLDVVKIQGPHLNKYGYVAESNIQKLYIYWMLQASQYYCRIQKNRKNTKKTACEKRIPEFRLQS